LRRVAADRCVVDTEVQVAEFRLLGAVEVWAGTSIDAGQPRQRAVLAALAVDAGRVVSVETLIDRVWGTDPPEQVHKALYPHIARVRRMLDQVATLDRTVGRLIHRSGGYVLEVGRDQVDLHRFHRLSEQARSEDHDPYSRGKRFTEALALWRGEPLAGLRSDWAVRMRESWRLQHVDVVTAWAETELISVGPTRVIGPLTDLLAENPLAESLAAVLMRALHAAGHSAQALELFTRIRRRLADDLGADPGAELLSAHRAVLRREPPPPLPASTPAGQVRTPAVQVRTPDEALVGRPAVVGTADKPALLPHDIRAFACRDAELAELDSVLAMTAIAVVSGTAGIGKTALAVHWAHRACDQFPDGQLYVDLHGFGPHGSAVRPDEAVRRFLDALGVPARRIPTDPATRVDLYRSEMAGRRVLVVLDNARDAGQVRPLLPGTPACRVIVTSRNEMTGLVTAEGAQPLTLQLLDPERSRDLLAGRLGAAPLAAEPAAVNHIVTRCAGLPLALAMVAARAAITAGVPLTALAAELHDAAGTLDAFASDDPSTDVRAVFSWSYQALGADAASLFRLLSLAPGPDISTAAAASLSGRRPGQVRALLTELTRGHLLNQHATDRYVFHDLLRAYATELVEQNDSEDDTAAALHRLLDHYLQTAHRAAFVQFPSRSSTHLDAPQPGVVVGDITDQEQAAAWFRTEHQVLIATVRHAAVRGFGTYSWQLTWALATFLDRQGHWSDLAEAALHAMPAAKRLADRTGQARMHRLLARAQLRLGHPEEAAVHLHQALDLHDASAERADQGHVHYALSDVLSEQGHHDLALTQMRQALELFRVAGDEVWQANALSGLGWFYAQSGEFQQTLEACTEALALQLRIGTRQSQSCTLDTLGFAHFHLGHHDQAIACFRRAVAGFEEVHDLFNLAVTLVRRAEAHDATGHRDAARRDRERAVTIYDELSHSDAAHLRTVLSRA
jgi:DNA-binding SARP family transcriptional activator/tetratricopeptide (TPR) repeat protein